MNHTLTDFMPLACPYTYNYSEFFYSNCIQLALLNSCSVLSCWRGFIVAHQHGMCCHYLLRLGVGLSNVELRRCHIPNFPLNLDIIKYIWSVYKDIYCPNKLGSLFCRYPRILKCCDLAKWLSHYLYFFSFSFLFWTYYTRMESAGKYHMTNVTVTNMWCHTR